jgi:hypothetical protein
VLLIRALFTRLVRHRGAIAGMALFWAGGALAVWLALAAFGFVMNGAALIVGYATGMVFTRRTAPLAGSGTLTLILPLTIRACGAPLATAITGVWAYRLLCFWLALPPALASLPVLRETTRQTAITGPAVPGKRHRSAVQRRPSGDHDADDATPDANDAASSPGREGRSEQGQAERDDDRSPVPDTAPDAITVPESGASPQAAQAAVNRSSDTTSLAWTSKTASNTRCLGCPSSTRRSPSWASSGPSSLGAGPGQRLTWPSTRSSHGKRD